MGADVYSRLLFGARITILIGVIAVGASLLVGVPIGLVAGYYHGWFSDLLMRVSDVFLAVPQVVLAIAIAQTLGPSLPNVILALSATYWPWFARVVYAETRTLQKEVFVESTAALGASPWRLTALHVLPNIASPIIVRASIGMGRRILTAAALGVLGLGPARASCSSAGAAAPRRPSRAPSSGSYPPGPRASAAARCASRVWTCCERTPPRSTTACAGARSPSSLKILTRRSARCSPSRRR